MLQDGGAEREKEEREGEKMKLGEHVRGPRGCEGEIRVDTIKTQCFHILNCQRINKRYF